MLSGKRVQDYIAFRIVDCGIKTIFLHFHLRTPDFFINILPQIFDNYCYCFSNFIIPINLYLKLLNYGSESTTIHGND